MSLRVCSEKKCPILVDKRARDGRCAKHQREIRQRRGSSTQQGYGAEHRSRRDRLIAAAIGTWCPTCPEDRPTLMTDPAQMVADHSDPLSHNRGSHADRVHCRTCSNRQGGRLAHPTNP